MVFQWDISGILTVHYWYIEGTLLVYCWYMNGILLVYYWDIHIILSFKDLQPAFTWRHVDFRLRQVLPVNVN